MHPFAATEPSPLNPKKKNPTHRIAFTKTALDALNFDPSGQKGWQWHHDLRMPGLAIGVSEGGVKSFYLIRKINGKALRMSLGRYPTVSLETARGEAYKRNQLIAQGIDPTQMDKGEQKFSDLFDRYMNDYARKRNRTAEDNVVTYNRYLATDRYGVNLGKMRLCDITKDKITRIIAGVSDHAPVHANRVLALLRSIFNRAINWEVWTKPNPCKGIERNPEVSRERSVSAIEMPYLLNALELEQNETLRDFVKAALFTGARRSNVLEMRWDAIDWDSGLWNISMTKNGHSQSIPLIPAMFDLLRQRQRESGTAWVFPSSGASGHYVEPKKGWKVLLARATALRLVDKLAEQHGWNEQESSRALSLIIASPEGALELYQREAQQVGIWLKPLDMRDLRVHDLRRTLGSWQANANISLNIIGKTLGHLSPQSTKVYARVALDPVRDAMILATNNMLNPSNRGLGHEQG
jgi:integrase